MKTDKTNVHMEADLKAERPGNLVCHVSWTHKLIWITGSLISGGLVSICFPPLEFSWYAWFSLLPILCIGLKPVSKPFFFGYLFGFAHFATTYFWLNEVFILASAGLASIYAFIPAVWISCSRKFIDYLDVSEDEELFPGHDPSIEISHQLTAPKVCFVIIFMSCFWCGLEWCRSWFMTGFPWNQFGISQWQNFFLLPLSQITGVYGISFLIVTVNLSLYFSGKYLIESKQNAIDIKPVLWFISPVIILLILVSLWYTTLPEESKPQETLNVAAVQGNIPQSRIWTQEQLDLAIDVYTRLTREIVSSENPDLVVWPETAIPASLLYNEQCYVALRSMSAEIKTQLIAGTINYRFPPVANGTGELPRSFNSCIYFDKNGDVIDSYDKIHLVPFGEYVPFEAYIPRLNDWIGMGRSLSEGREYTVMAVQNKAHIGINICYEDIFPEISRRMVLEGANVLLVITNDAWFGESSGARQHLSHAVFRAVENQRPILRNGNNSDTCIIMPNGEIKDLMRDPVSGSSFARMARVYKVPIWESLTTTFYTRYGNVFAVFCFVISLLGLIWCFTRFLDKKRKLYELITEDSEKILS